jgi:hypothetical protein
MSIRRLILRNEIGGSMKNRKRVSIFIFLLIGAGALTLSYQNCGQIVKDFVGDGGTRQGASSLGANQCTYNSVLFNEGDNFTSTDGCNTCICEKGGNVTCTEKSCETSATCTYNGSIYVEGNEYPSADGCNSCTCGADGNSVCTEDECKKQVTCEYNGNIYNEGDTFPSTDGCNTCSCGSDSSVSCTEKACRTVCSYNGKLYNPGDNFPASDGCNTCSCTTSGTVLCSKMYCIPGGEKCLYKAIEYDRFEVVPVTDRQSCFCSDGRKIICKETIQPKRF